MDLARKLAIGTAQFGFKYGVANNKGKVAREEIVRILNRAYKYGIDTLDTAIGYGEAEAELGRTNLSGWRVVSKLPALPDRQMAINEWINSEVTSSIKRLGIPRLSGLLLHRASDLLGDNGDQIEGALQDLKESGLVDKIGVSVYDFNELRAISDLHTLDLVQVPFNCIDRRLVESGTLPYLKGIGIEVHVRSTFLQGILLMSKDSRPVYFKTWQGIWDIWDNWILEKAIDPIAACLRLPLSYPDIDRIIVGVDSLDHFSQILDSLEIESIDPPDGVICDDPDLINPSRWRL